MSDIQGLGQQVSKLISDSNKAATGLYNLANGLQKTEETLLRLMQSTSQRNYQDIVNQLAVAKIKLANAADNLAMASQSGNRWLEQHVNGIASQVSTSESGVFTVNTTPDTTSAQSPLATTEDCTSAQNYGQRDYSIISQTSNGGYSRHFSPEEAAAYYQRVVESVDEIIQTYHTELVAHGAMNGAMLTKFLAKQRSYMLQYEAEEINVAQGLREPLSDEERYHYVIVGENSPYGYDKLLDEFGQFCMSDIQSWISTINPNPNNDPRRHVNCGKCAAAVFQRLNGNNNAVAGLGTYSISEMNSITGRIQTPMSPSDIEKYLRTQGAGSHVVVGVDRASGAGHWFNAFFDGHQVYTIEGQCGEINGWPPDYGNVVLWDASV